MKKTLLIIALAAVGLVAAAQEQKPVPRLNPGVGPVMNVNTNQTYGSNLRVLPENAQTFVNTLFPDVAVAEVERDVKDQEYEVKMANGYEVLFDYNGNWLEVESPDNAMLSSGIVKQLVPENVVVETLAGNAVVPGGVIDYIEEIDYVPGFGYVVEYAVSPRQKGKVAVDSKGNVSDVKALKSCVSKDGKGKKSAKYGKIRCAGDNNGKCRKERKRSR